MFLHFPEPRLHNLELNPYYLFRALNDFLF